MLLLAVGAALGLAAPAAHATLLVDANFSPTGLASGASMGGAPTNALGLTGNYTLTNLNTGNVTATMTYDPTALSFGNLAVSGGSVVFNSGSSAFGKLSLSAKISASTSASTIYGSYLFQVASDGSYHRRVTAAEIGPSAGYDKSSVIFPGVQEYDLTNAEAGLSQLTVNHQLAGQAIGFNTPYLALYEVSGLGATSGTVSMSEWILNSAQYDYFVSHSGLDPTTLNAATTGTAAGDVLQSGTATGTPTKGYPTLNGQYMSLFAYSSHGAGTNSLVTFGEYRISDSSLAQAAPAVPEPASLGLVAAGGLGLLLLRRRRAV